MHREFISNSQTFRFVGLDSEHAHNDGKTVNHRLPVWELPRGRNSLCSNMSAASGDENDQDEDDDDLIILFYCVWFSTGARGAHYQGQNHCC